MASVASLPRPCLSTSREEIRQCGLMLAAGRGRSKKIKNRNKSPPHPKHTTKSRAARRPCPTRVGMRGKHVSRISPYSPASIDLGFVEIGLVQLWQSVKTTSVTHTLSDRQTDRQTDYFYTVSYTHLTLPTKA